MPAIFYSDRALDDLDRLFDFIARTDPAAAGRAAELIIDGVRVLERHPLIGRPVRGGLRELLISHGRSGYVALYRIDTARSRIEVLALRHPREADTGSTSGNAFGAGSSPNDAEQPKRPRPRDRRRAVDGGQSGAEVGS